MKIFYIMGRSGCGKDTVKNFLLKQEDFRCENLIEATTRPPRIGETDEHLFLSENDFNNMIDENKFIEHRSYEVNTSTEKYWKYATLFPESTEKYCAIYIGTGTLESYKSLIEYYKGENVVYPILLDVSDYNLLYRSITREIGAETEKFKEICRRFITDLDDYSESKIEEMGISKHCRFDNNRPISEVLSRIRAYVIRNTKYERFSQKEKYINEN